MPLGPNLNAPCVDAHGEGSSGPSRTIWGPSARVAHAWRTRGVRVAHAWSTAKSPGRHFRSGTGLTFGEDECDDLD